VPLPLSDILSALERVAPLRFAEPWDNVGLLLEPAPSLASGGSRVQRALLTIDLNELVLDEAEAAGATLVIAYHPPIFKGLTRLRCSVPAERVVVRCLTRGIAVFSPHTALDAAPGGVNDWLLAAFGEGARKPCLPHPDDEKFGQGRCVTLATPITLSDAVSRIKAHLGLTLVRVAAAAAHEASEPPASIRRIAVGAGAGGSLFEKLSGYDLYLTGELRHHDVLTKCALGESVVLCDHTNTERGFLPMFAERLTLETHGAVSFQVSRCDRDPLRVL